MAEERTLQWGDTVRGEYDKIYPGWKPPPWALEKLEKRWLKANPMSKSWDEVKAGQAYSFPTSSYSAQLGLRSQIRDKSRLTPEEYILISTAMNRSRLGQESQVNALRKISKKTGKFKLPTSGVSASLMKTIMDGGEEDIQNQIIHMAAQEDLPTTGDFNEWYEQWKFDPIYFKEASEAHQAKIKFKRGGEAHDIKRRKDAEVQIIENISDDMMEAFNRGEMGSISVDDWLNNNYGEVDQLHYRIAERYRTLVKDKRDRLAGEQASKKRKLELTAAKESEAKTSEEKVIERMHREATAKVVALVNGDLSRLTEEQRANIRNRHEGKVPEAMSITEAMNIVFPQYNNLPYWDSSKVKEDIYAEVGTRGERKPPEKTNKQQVFEYWMGLRKKSGIDDSDQTRARLFDEYMLTQRERLLGMGPKQVTEALNKQLAFGNVSNLIPQMLRQLHNRKLTIGVVGSFFKGWENITDQFTQLAHTIQAGTIKGRSGYTDKDLLNPNIYDWSRGSIAAALHTDVIQLAYSLARAADPNAKLSDFDIQVQLDRLSAGGQSKSSMALALIKIHNTNVDSMRTLYNTYGGGTSDTVPGFNKTWHQFLAGHNTNRIMRVPSKVINGVVYGALGYERFSMGADGIQEKVFVPIVKWVVGDEEGL